MKKIIPAFLLVMLCSSCYYFFNINELPAPTFDPVKGIRYTEIRREFDTGIAIDQNGFHLEPEWRIYFTGNDSVKIFNESRGQYMPYRIFHSHKNLFQFARRWFRVLHVSPDSIRLKVMVVHDRKINDEASKVYMTLYSDTYIKHTLQTSVAKLRDPTSSDSLYVKYRAIQSNTDPDSAFAAKTPVIFTARSSIIKIEKIKPVIDPNLEEFEKIDEYLNPVYRITIDKAYKDFSYSFYMLVDHQGKMKFKKFNFPIEGDFVAVKTKLAKAIIDVYLNNLLKVEPGTTLGYKHASAVEVYVIGRKTPM